MTLCYFTIIRDQIIERTVELIRHWFTYYQKQKCNSNLYTKVPIQENGLVPYFSGVPGVMVLTNFYRNIPISAPEVFKKRMRTMRVLDFNRFFLKSFKFV